MNHLQSKDESRICNSNNSKFICHVKFLYLIITQNKTSKPPTKKNIRAYQTWNALKIKRNISY